MEVYARAYHPRRPMVCMDETHWKPCCLARLSRSTSSFAGECEPKTANGSPKRFHEWGLAQLIDVAWRWSPDRPQPCGGGCERRTRQDWARNGSRACWRGDTGGRAGGPGHGQPEQARNRIAVRDLRALARSPTGGTTRNPLHAGSTGAGSTLQKSNLRWRCPEVP